MSNLKNKWTLVFSFLVHILFLVSIFDIYFRSPITLGIKPVNNAVPPLAKRLILISCDGLRADSFFEFSSREYNSSYLRYIIENRGRWGVGHAAVPTESRPGHVAIIAGFNEDPSAIFKGWKVNPVEFDSVFNQSVSTFGWGSPDILLMFCEESNKDRIFMNTYPSAFQDFSGLKGAAARESLWTFENFKQFLREAKSNPHLMEKLNQNGVIYFLHLLGTDTSGHAHKPHSEEYVQNIRIADEIMKQTEELIKQFYNDDQSVFLFTSDHGMSDWGSHGASSLSETEVPYVVWGSGILEPKITYNTHSPVFWNLNQLERIDINQNDLAPLMSVLLGISIPVNSLGTVPVTILNCSDTVKSSILLLNVQQMLAQFMQKRKTVEDTTLKFIYKPFAALSDGKDFGILQKLKSQFQNGHYSLVIDESRNLIELCLAGLSYYHNYYQKLLLFCISFSYIGWICWLLLNLSASDTIEIFYHTELWNKRDSWLRLIDCAFIALISASLLLLSVQSLPCQYYLYCCLPSIIWWNILRKLAVSHFKCTLKYSDFLFSLLSTVIGSELVVLSFFERRILSLIMFFVMFWPLISIKKKVSRNEFFLLWILSCISVMVFPFLPVLGRKPNDIFIILSTTLWWIIIIASWKILNQVPSACAYSNSQGYFTAFIILFGVALANILYVSFTSANYGLSILSQLISWILLLLVPFIPILSSRKLVLRLLYIYFALGIVSLLFSVNHEALFSPLFSFHLFLWFLAENIISDQNNHLVLDLSCAKFSRMMLSDSTSLKSSDLRRAFLFFYYTVLSFFGVGNIASISSFDTTWVRCFVMVFAPYTITILTLIKLVIPFIATACTFRAVNDISKVVIDKIFLVVLIYCDVMGLNFLFLVKNVGSWLEIGSSVSHYVISQSITLFLVLLYFFSGYLTFTKIKKFERLVKFNKFPSKTA